MEAAAPFPPYAFHPLMSLFCLQHSSHNPKRSISLLPGENVIGRGLQCAIRYPFLLKLFSFIVTSKQCSRRQIIIRLEKGSLSLNSEIGT